MGDFTCIADKVVCALVVDADVRCLQCVQVCTFMNVGVNRHHTAVNTRESCVLFNTLYIPLLPSHPG